MLCKSISKIRNVPFPRPCGTTGNDAQKLHAPTIAHFRGALLTHEVLCLRVFVEQSGFRKLCLRAKERGFVGASESVQMNAAGERRERTYAAAFKVQHELRHVVAAGEPERCGELTVYRVIDRHVPPRAALRDHAPNLTPRTPAPVHARHAADTPPSARDAVGAPQRAGSPAATTCRRSC